MRPTSARFLLRASAAWLALAALLRAHPIPDIPVNASFEAGGDFTIQVEVDPRCFEIDPNTAPSVLNEELGKTRTEKELAEWKAKARDYIRQTVKFFFDPKGAVDPEFSFEFTGQGGVPLVRPDDIVVLTGTWKSTVPEGSLTYRIRALEGGKLCVLFLNKIRGEKVKRFAVLFPGEESFALNLDGSDNDVPADEEVEQPVEEGNGWRVTYRNGVISVGSLVFAGIGLWWMARRTGWLKGN